MIQGFLDSWELFAPTYLAAWAGIALLGLVGVSLVMRNQFFAGAAMTQAGGFGIAVGLELGHLLPSVFGGVPTGTLSGVMAVTAAVVGSLAALLGRKGDEATEALTAWIFLTCGAAMIVIVAHSPFGLKEIHDRMASSVIGAGTNEAILYGVLFAVWGGLTAVLRRPLTLLLVDRVMAAACGVRIRLWEFCLALAIGLTVGIAVRGMGMLLTFGALILPALVARGICREAQSLFWVAPLIGLIAGLSGFVLGDYWDSPQGPLCVVILGCFAVLVAVGKPIIARIRG